MRSASTIASSRSCVTWIAVMPSALCSARDLVAQLDAHRVVEVGQRLVEQQQTRVDRERAAERDALALSAGELGRPPAGRSRRAAAASASRRRARRSCPSTRRACAARSRCWRPRHVRPQRVGLEHHRRVAPLGRQVRHVARRRPDRAGLGVTKPAIERSTVVLPQPELPSSATSSPRSTSRLTRSSHPRASVRHAHVVDRQVGGHAGAGGRRPAEEWPRSMTPPRWEANGGSCRPSRPPPWCTAARAAAHSGSSSSSSSSSSYSRHRSRPLPPRRLRPRRRDSPSAAPPRRPRRGGT